MRTLSVIPRSEWKPQAYRISVGLDTGDVFLTFLLQRLLKEQRWAKLLSPLQKSFLSTDSIVFQNNPSCEKQDVRLFTPQSSSRSALLVYSVIRYDGSVWKSSFCHSVLLPFFICFCEEIPSSRSLTYKLKEVELLMCFRDSSPQT